jgi:hypothetical protein
MIFLGVLSPLLLLLLVHGFLYNEIGTIAASRGVNYGPLVAELVYQLVLKRMPVVPAN